MPPRKRSPGNIERRGNGFRIRLCVAGERHYVTVQTPDRKEAQRFARERLAELERQAARAKMGLTSGVRFSELLNAYIEAEVKGRVLGTRRSYECSFVVFREYFIRQLGDPVIESIRARHVTAFMTWRRSHAMNGGARVSPRTVQRDRTVLHRLFAFAEELEYRDGNPVARTKAPKVDSRDPILLSETEYERLLEECADRPFLRLFVLTLAESGIRSQSEALHLRWRDVDLESGFLWIGKGPPPPKGSQDRHRTKSGKGRWVPMTPRLLGAMRDHFATYRLARYNGRPTEWVFHHPATRARVIAGSRIGTIRVAFKSAARRAGLSPELHQHDLRHRRVTTWLAEGKNPVHVKEAMGHSDLRVTMGYTHLAREHLRSLVGGEGSREALDDLKTPAPKQVG